MLTDHAGNTWAYHYPHTKFYENLSLHFRKGLRFCWRITYTRTSIHPYIQTAWQRKSKWDPQKRRTGPQNRPTQNNEIYLCHLKVTIVNSNLKFSFRKWEPSWRLVVPRPQHRFAPKNGKSGWQNLFLTQEMRILINLNQKNKTCMSEALHVPFSLEMTFEFP